MRYLKVFLVLALVILFLGTNLTSIGKIEAKTQVQKENNIWNWEIDPFEYTISHSLAFFNKHFNQDIKDPFQRGFHLNIDWDWGNNNWQEIGLEYRHQNGMTYQISHIKLKNQQQFNKKSYQVIGSKDKIEFNQISLSNQKLNGEIYFQDNKFIKHSQEIRQKYLIFDFSFLNYFDSDFEVGFTSGLSLDMVNPDYVRLTVDYKKVKRLKKESKINYSLHAGLASTPLPLNHQFQGGGFSQLPLRGHSNNLAGTRYLTGNLEYHHKIYESLTGILFLDTGKIIPEGETFNSKDWIIDGGFGLKYNTPFGKLLNLGIGYNLKNSNYNWHIGLENSF